MRYLKHKYSKRVYRVMEDHGPDHPYLSCHPFIRYPSKATCEKFFTPIDAPSGETPLVSVLKEIEWEKRQLRKNEPLKVVAPEPIKRPKPKRSTPQKEWYSLKDLCSDLGISPSTARRLLRSKGKVAPDSGWRWNSKEEAKPIKRFLKKLL